MAININITNDNTSIFNNEIIYTRLNNQTPLDFAVTYLENIESLFSFYNKFKLINYNDFYNNSKYRISNINNDMKAEGFEATTKTI